MDDGDSRCRGAGGGSVHRARRHTMAGRWLMIARLWFRPTAEVRLSCFLFVVIMIFECRRTEVGSSVKCDLTTIFNSYEFVVVGALLQGR